jgi:hypothetical protein
MEAFKETKVLLRCLMDYFREECLRMAKERVGTSDITRDVEYRGRISELREEVVDQIFEILFKTVKK